MLEDLHAFIEKTVSMFDADYFTHDKELPQSFKDYLINHPDGKDYVFNRYSTVIRTDLNIYSPNQWFYIAAYFCKLYPLLQKYRELAIQSLCPNLGIKEQKVFFENVRDNELLIMNSFDKAGFDQDTKQKLWKFVSDYQWWRGGKGIERQDFYYSPILSAAQLVNASQSYVAEICKYLISNPEALNILNDEIKGSENQQELLYEDKNIVRFMAECMKEFLRYDTNLSKAINLIKFNKVTAGFNGCAIGELKSKADQQTDPRRLDDCDKEISWTWNDLDYYFLKEQSSGTLSIFQENINEIYKSIYYIAVENGINRLYKLHSSKFYKKELYEAGSLQQIFYGAPGTGKSHKVNETICNLPKENVFRTTFHPDSDYSTFVGCYKPTKESVKLRDVTGKTIKDNVEGKEVDVTENRITYEFVPQVFTKAYVRAYKTDGPVFLVIEEINRGNCAQIFGDIFQLLDRDDCGVSAYAVKPDSDLENYLMEQLGDKYDPNEGMRLPNNLHIWATMNTSDQSLFPIDSAFKRRWDWVYVPIENHADKGYEIEVGNEKYDWWEFLDKMNERIYRATTSEDKKMGYFFVKLKKGEKKISEDVMVNKVLFYLFNDVFKDFDSEGLFKVDNKLMHFSDYHDKNNRSTLLKDLMSKLSLEPTNAESTQQAKQDNLDNAQN